MPFCSNCGIEIPEEAQFCPKCGKPTQIPSSNNSKKIKPAYDSEYGKIYTILGVISFPLVIIFNWKSPTSVTFILGLLTLVLAIFVLVKKCRLKIFPILAIALEIFCLAAMLFYSNTNQSAQEKSSVTKNNETKSQISSVDPDLKKFLDSYEDFVDDYVVFMEKYKNNPTDLSLLSDYTDFVSDYNSYLSTLNKYDSSSMSNEDYEYYIDVTARCNKKLLKVLNTE